LGAPLLEKTQEVAHPQLSVRGELTLRNTGNPMQESGKSPLAGTLDGYVIVSRLKKAFVTLKKSARQSIEPLRRSHDAA
jgi:hypothetical protein